MPKTGNVLLKRAPYVENFVSGTGLCSYRVRGVDGSCAKHLTVEPYAVVMLLTVILINIISVPSTLTPLFQKPA